MATELFPIIETRDLRRSLAFYCDLLGGSVSYEFPGPDGEVVYAGVNIGMSHLGIGLAGDAMAPAARVLLWVYVEDCDATVAALRQAGVNIVEDPVDQTWGERVALVEDPDGILVRVANRSAGQDVESGGGSPTPA